MPLPQDSGCSIAVGAKGGVSHLSMHGLCVVLEGWRRACILGSRHLQSCYWFRLFQAIFKQVCGQVALARELPDQCLRPCLRAYGTVWVHISTSLLSQMLRHLLQRYSMLSKFQYYSVSDNWTNTCFFYLCDLDWGFSLLAGSLMCVSICSRLRRLLTAQAGPVGPPICGGLDSSNVKELALRMNF